MQKKLSEIRKKITWVQNMLRAPKLGNHTRRRALIYLSAMVLMLGKSQKAAAAPSFPESDEIKTEIMNNDKDTKSLDSKSLELFRLSTAEILKRHQIEEVSLADLKKVCRQSEFEFSTEELKAMKPGKLALSLARQSKAIANGKPCLGKCFNKFKSVLFSHASKQLLKQVNDSYVPQHRWNTLSAFKGKEDMQTLPQFICTKLAYENYKNIPDGSAVVFMPSPKHPHGHIAWKCGEKFFSDGQEIIDNIPEGKYGQAYAFIPEDNTMPVIPKSPHLAQLATDLRLKSMSKDNSPKFSQLKTELPAPNIAMTQVSRN